MRPEICARCDRPTDEPVVVGTEHGASAGGRTTYACPPCAPSFPKQVNPFTAVAAVRRTRRPGRSRLTGWA
ncbi:hypothetical protein [Streptomyces sp. DASNCL29]|uniref:hypothetical protein n=1 Tax=Streptomyces sp. DASNCL29 TaxID=2583819 RepID=UPI00110F8150|nr:hypothetical protein [Streptomyces sp. DASNCL29]TMU90053.1 hypothetical protein FGK60_41385 [Streptomyces sp. DASNCL29]